MSRSPLHDGVELGLVFSGEFNNNGRTSYFSDDPYWEAIDCTTGKSPTSSGITKDGVLKITLSKQQLESALFHGRVPQGHCGLVLSERRFRFVARSPGDGEPGRT